MTRGGEYRTTYRDLQEAEEKLEEAGLEELLGLLEELDRRRDTRPPAESDGTGGMTGLPLSDVPTVEREAGDGEEA